MSDPIVRALAVVADTEAPREDRAKACAEIVRGARDYRAVSIYDVGDGEIGLLGQSGAQAQPDPHADATLGLSAEAEQTRMTVVSRDGSQAIVPILGAESGVVIGTLDVESAGTSAFSSEGISFLEDCAAVLRPLFD